LLNIYVFIFVPYFSLVSSLGKALKSTKTTNKYNDVWLCLQLFQMPVFIVSFLFVVVKL